MREQCALGEAPSLTHAQMNHRNVHTEERLLATQPRIHARTQARTTPCASSTAKAWANTQARKHARTRRTRPAAHASARIDLRDGDRIELFRTARVLRVPALLRKLLLAAPVVRITKMMTGQRRMSTVKKHAGAPLLAPRAPSLVRTHTPEANGRTLRNTKAHLRIH